MLVQHIKDGRAGTSERESANVSPQHGSNADPCCEDRLSPGTAATAMQTRPKPRAHTHTHTRTHTVDTYVLHNVKYACILPLNTDQC